MKQATNLYKQLRTQAGSYYEVQVIRGNTTYGMDKLKSVRIMQALYQDSGPQIGGVNSSKCVIDLIYLREASANWPRMAAFEVQARIVSESGNTKDSQWLSWGTFFTDQRKDDKRGNLKIVAYDSMLMLEQTWLDKLTNAPSSWPITARHAANLLEQITYTENGVEKHIVFDDKTTLDDNVAYIGKDSTSTARDVLRSIAVGCGGNWYVTPAGKLKLIRVVNRASIPAIAGIAVAGISIVGDATTPSGGESFETVQVGMSVKTLETNTPTEAVTGVEIESDTGLIAFAGYRTGYVLKAHCGFANSAIAGLCLSKVQGYIYRPFEAASARLDPVAELGDYADIANATYPIITLDWKIGKKITADISAPFDEEVDHEYTPLSSNAKQYKKIIDAASEQMETAITQSEASILLEASRTYVEKTTYEEDLERLYNQIDGAIMTWEGNTVPTLNNLPASDWTSDADKAEHVGDLYLVSTNAGISEAGNYYRFERHGSTYSWNLLSDTVLTQALTQAQAAAEAAERAQLAAEGAQNIVSEKAKVFIKDEQHPYPEPPYYAGDLWFKDGAIYVCVQSKNTSGAYSASDWVKKDTYVDESSLEDAVTRTVNAKFETAAESITASVEETISDSFLRTEGGERSSFSWELTLQGHKWFSNGNEVMSISSNGLSVEGEIRATSGYIGTANDGFIITSSSIRKGMESLTDTDHNGVYIGTDGIALGAGNFKVTSSGAATMKNLQVTGGSISIGQYVDDQGNTQPTFYVSSDGTLHAENGVFNGTIYAENIAHAVSEEQLASAIQNALAAAKNYAAVTATQLAPSTTIPPYFRAGIIVASEYFYSDGYYVDTGNESTEFDLANHYHNITANDNTGVVTIGAPVKNSGTPPSFNIAATSFYQNNVAAARTSGANSVEIKSNANNGIVSISNSGEWDREVNITASKKTAYSPTANMLYGYVNIALTNDKTFSARIGITAAKVPQSSSEWGLFTPINPSNPNASTDTEKYFTLSVGSESDSGNIEIYTESDSTANYVRYNTTKGSYRTGTLFTFGKTNQRNANQLSYAKNENDENIWNSINVIYDDGTFTTLSISPNAYNAGRNSYSSTRKDITSNGTYTPQTNERWSSVVVNVPSSGSASHSITPASNSSSWNDSVRQYNFTVNNSDAGYVRIERNGNTILGYYANSQSDSDIADELFVFGGTQYRYVTGSQIVANTDYNQIKLSYNSGDDQTITLPYVWNQYLQENSSIYDLGYYAGYNDADGGDSATYTGSYYTLLGSAEMCIVNYTEVPIPLYWYDSDTGSYYRYNATVYYGTESVRYDSGDTLYLYSKN